MVFLVNLLIFYVKNEQLGANLIILILVAKLSIFTYKLNSCVYKDFQLNLIKLSFRFFRKIQQCKLDPKFNCL